MSRVWQCKKYKLQIGSKLDLGSLSNLEIRHKSCDLVSGVPSELNTMLRLMALSFMVRDRDTLCPFYLIY